MRRSLRSKRDTISPTRPRSTASGLRRTRVRSAMTGRKATTGAAREALATSCQRREEEAKRTTSPPSVTPQDRAGFADHVERADDEDRIVGIGHPQRGTAGVRYRRDRLHVVAAHGARRVGDLG